MLLGGLWAGYELAVSYRFAIYGPTIGWLSTGYWLAGSYLLATLAIYQMAIRWLLAGYWQAGYQMAIGWQLAGYWLAIDWLSAVCWLTMGWLWAGYQLSISWILAGYWLAMFQHQYTSRHSYILYTKVVHGCYQYFRL